VGEIEVPPGALVVLVGVAGSGKSSLAGRSVRASEVLALADYRELVFDDRHALAATPAAFAVLCLVADRRLALRRTCVVDATNLVKAARRRLLDIARANGAPAVAVVLDLPPSEAALRDATREGREQVGAAVIKNQRGDLLTTLRSIGKEGFDRVVTLTGSTEIDAARLVTR
jgi:protein phosphatase